MLNLTDTDGDPLLIQEGYILRVCTFRMPSGMKVTGYAYPPKSIIVQADGMQIGVVQSVEQIQCMLKGYGGEEP